MNVTAGDFGPLTNGRISLAAQILFAASIGALCTLSPVAYARFIAEDHWGEYATFAAFFIASGLFAVAARVSRNERWPRRAWCVLLSLATFLVAMEEISWGQRILSIATPEALARINNQNELTFHNISFVENVIPYTSVVSFAVFGYGVLIAALSTMVSPIRRLLLKSGFVFPGLHLAPTFLLASWLLMLPFYKSEELGELFVGFGVMLLASDHLGSWSSSRNPGNIQLRNFLIVCIGAISLWILGAYGLVPALIESAYQGESLTFFNDLLSGRTSHPLAEYLGTWRSVSNVGLAFLGAGAVISALFIVDAHRSSHRFPWSSGWPRVMQAPVLVGVALGLGIFISLESEDPGSFHVLLGELSDRAIDNDDYSRAHETLRFMEKHEIGPRRDLVYRLGRLAHAEGNSSEGVLLMREALALELSGLDDSAVQPARLHRIAEIHSHLGDSTGATKFRERALAHYDQQLNEATLDELRADLYMQRADTLVSMNRFELALDSYLRASQHAVHGIQRKRIWLGIVYAVNLCRPSSDETQRDLPAYWHSDSWNRVREFAARVDAPEGAWCSESW